MKRLNVSVLKKSRTTTTYAKPSAFLRMATLARKQAYIDNTNEIFRNGGHRTTVETILPPELCPNGPPTDWGVDLLKLLRNCAQVESDPIKLRQELTDRLNAIRAAKNLKGTRPIQHVEMKEIEKKLLNDRHTTAADRKKATRSRRTARDRLTKGVRVVTKEASKMTATTPPATSNDVPVKADAAPPHDSSHPARRGSNQWFRKHPPKVYSGEEGRPGCADRLFLPFWGGPVDQTPRYMLLGNQPAFRLQQASQQGVFTADELVRYWQYDFGLAGRRLQDNTSEPLALLLANRPPRGFSAVDSRGQWAELLAIDSGMPKKKSLAPNTDWPFITSIFSARTALHPIEYHIADLSIFANAHSKWQFPVQKPTVSMMQGKVQDPLKAIAVHRVLVILPAPQQGTFPDIPAFRPAPPAVVEMAGPGGHLFFRNAVVDQAERQILVCWQDASTTSSVRDLLKLGLLVAADRQARHIVLGGYFDGVGVRTQLGRCRLFVIGSYTRCRGRSSRCTFTWRLVMGPLVGRRPAN